MPSGHRENKMIVDIRSLPADWPTNRHEPAFWEALGRTVATFGFLEEVLGKAIFALTSTHKYPENEIEAAYETWLKTLERALSDSLIPLIRAYKKSAQAHPEFSTTNLDGLVLELKSAADLRNVLCHGSWRPPNEVGQSIPLFVNRQSEIFETAIDIAYLDQVRTHVAELAANVVSTVTHMGIPFPGIQKNAPLFSEAFQ